MGLHRSLPRYRNDYDHLGGKKAYFLDVSLRKRISKRYPVIVNEFGDVEVDNDPVVDTDVEIFR